MSVQIVTGHSQSIRPWLYQSIRKALSEPSDAPLYLLVPEQYTLQSERDVLAAAGLQGSFRLQVMSTARMISRVFEACGAPAEARLDERGRVMMTHAATRALHKSLQWFRGAERQAGFSELAAQQIREFKQAGLDPASLNALSERLEGPLRRKTSDLALIWLRYEGLMAGRYMDGEDELGRALRLIDRAPFLDGARIWLNGYELISPTLGLLAAGLGARHEVTLTLPLSGERARDSAAYEPVRRTLGQFEALLDQRGVEHVSVQADDPPRDDRPADIRHLLREINAVPARPFAETPEHVTLSLCRNPFDEAMTAMADIRRHVMDGSIRYRDAAVVCWDLQAMREPLARAAALYGVPLFLADGRGADRNPLCQFALCALRLIDGGWQADDMDLLMGTGYTGLTPDECDLISDCAVEQGLRGRLWKEPLHRFTGDVNPALEPLRQKLTAPLIAFEEAFASAGDTAARLGALWRLLEDVGAYDRLLSTQEECVGAGLHEAANENAQAWNRLMSTLDQLHELMGDTDLNARELYDLMSQSLAASDLRPLPQSGDAVMAGSLSHLRSGAVARLYVLGLNETDPGSDSGLVKSWEKASIHQADAAVWLAPDAADRGALSRLDLCASLAMARQSVSMSYSSSDAEGAALQPGSVITRLKRGFPALKAARPDLAKDGPVLCSTPRAAMMRLGPTLRPGTMPDYGAGALAACGPEWMDSLWRAVTASVASDPISRETARALYNGPAAMSVTRLERYARCPFCHFVNDGLKPHILKEYGLERNESGTFYHDALEQFLRQTDALNDRDPDDAARRMDDIAEGLIAPLMDGPLSESPVALDQARRMRSIARQAAHTVTRQLRGSAFRPFGVEIAFGPDVGSVVLKTNEGDMPLRGRIDRVDAWNDSVSTWIRVIDYKSGHTTMDLRQLYFGLQLQLIIYMAQALRDGGRPAGMFYFHVDDPCIDSESRDPDEIEAARTKALRLSGVFIDDPAVIEAFSPDPDSVVSTRGSTSKLSEEDFRLLMDHALKKASELAAGIMAGETPIAPRIIAPGKTSCSYCDYVSACLQDPVLGGMPLPLTPKIRQTDVMDLIAREAGVSRGPRDGGADDQ